MNCPNRDSQNEVAEELWNQIWESIEKKNQQNEDPKKRDKEKEGRHKKQKAWTTKKRRERKQHQKTKRKEQKERRRGRRRELAELCRASPEAQSEVAETICHENRRNASLSRGRSSGSGGHPSPSIPRGPPHLRWCGRIRIGTRIPFQSAP